MYPCLRATSAEASQEVQDVQHWTTAQRFEKEVQELKRRMGMPSKIVEVDPTTDHVHDSVKLIKEAKREDK
jgi:hypothetical protein